VRVERLAEVFLHSMEEDLVLKACDPEGHLVCAVAPPVDEDGENWNAKVRSLAGEFLTDQPCKEEHGATRLIDRIDNDVVF
jgi:hypothetical protein